MVIQGLGGRNKTDAPDRHLGGGAVVPRPRHRSRRAGVLDAHRPAVRPSGRDRRDQLPLPRGPELGPDAASSRTTSGSRALRDPAARDELRDAVEHYNRDPAQGHDGAAAAVERGVRRRGRASPSTRSCQSRSIADIADELRRRARRRHARPRARRGPRHRVPLADREPGVDGGGRRSAARPAHDRSASPTAARTWPATTAPTGARTSCGRGCSTATCGRSRRASARSPRCRPRCVGLADRGVIKPGRPGRPHDLRPRRRSARGRRSSCTTSPAASGASRRGARACRPPSSTASRSCCDGELTGRLPGQVVRARDDVDRRRRPAH